MRVTEIECALYLYHLTFLQHTLYRGTNILWVLGAEKH